MNSSLHSTKTPSIKTPKKRQLTKLKMKRPGLWSLKNNLMIKNHLFTPAKMIIILILPRSSCQNMDNDQALMTSSPKDNSEMKEILSTVLLVPPVIGKMKIVTLLQKDKWKKVLKNLAISVNQIEVKLEANSMVE